MIYDWLICAWETRLWNSDLRESEEVKMQIDGYAGKMLWVDLEKTKIESMLGAW